MESFASESEDSPVQREPPPAQVALAINGMGTFSWDLVRQVMQYDDPGLTVMGFRRGEFDGSLTALSERMLPEELPEVNDRVARALSDRTGFSLYFRVRHDDGWLRWTHTQGRVVCDAQGEPVRVVGIIRDASQELRAVDETQRLREARNDRRRQAHIVSHISDALAPTVTVEDVAEAVTTTRLLEQLGASSVILGLVDNGRMELVGANGVPQDLIRDFHLSRLSQPLPLTDAVRSGEAVFVTSRREYVERYPSLQPYLRQFSEATAAVYLPLIAHDSPIGSLGLTFDGKGHFPRDEWTVLMALGKVIAQSLQRAMLYDQEHELAAGLQSAMLPGRLPHVEGVDLATRYRSARSRAGIGGDWYDALALPDGQIAAIIGDVQGHDVTAAAVMGQLRIALRAYAAEGHPPSSVMTRASTFLAELDTDRFATCLLAVLNPRTGAVATVRAGHLEPILRRGDGSSVWLDTPGGLPLGIAAAGAGHAYPTQEWILEPGAALLLCTDGLLETRAEDLDAGRSRVIDVLGSGPAHPQALADHLLHAMGSYTGEEDDVALLLLRRSPHGPGSAADLEATVTLNAPDSLQEARVALREALRRWSMEPLQDTAELLACELATNALLHTEGEATLSARPVQHGRRALRLALTDSSPTPPQRRAAGELSTSGRGLMLIEELATGWGVEPQGHGKTVWCEIELPTG